MLFLCLILDLLKCKYNFLCLFFLPYWQKARTVILIVWHLAEIFSYLSVTTVGNNSHFIKMWLTTEQNAKLSELEISTPEWHFSRNLSISRKAISGNKMHRLLYPFWIKIFSQEIEDLFLTNLSVESMFSDHGALMKMQDKGLTLQTRSGSTLGCGKAI